MHDHQDVVRWADPQPGRAGRTNAACPASGRSTLDPLEAAFETDLAAWLAQLDADRRDRHVARVCVIAWLALLATLLAIPLLGLVAMAATVGVLLATPVLVWKAAGDGERIGGRGAVVAGESVEAGLPTFGPDARAQLVRLMNLSRASGRSAARPLLRAELREALSREPLAHWKPLLDLDDALRTDVFAFRAGRNWRGPA